MEVVKLRDGRPPLTDVTGRLRLLADEIDAGNHGSVTTAYVVIPIENNYPTILGFGDIESDNHPVFQLELAKQKFILNVTKRG